MVNFKPNLLKIIISGILGMTYAFSTGFGFSLGNILEKFGFFILASILIYFVWSLIQKTAQSTKIEKWISYTAIISLLYPIIFTIFNSLVGIPEIFRGVSDILIITLLALLSIWILYDKQNWNNWLRVLILVFFIFIMLIAAESMISSLSSYRLHYNLSGFPAYLILNRFINPNPHVGYGTLGWITIGISIWVIQAIFYFIIASLILLWIKKRRGKPQNLPVQNIPMRQGVNPQYSQPRARRRE